MRDDDEPTRMASRPSTSIPQRPREAERITVIGIYAWSTFWALGEGRGSPSFFLSPKGFVDAGHRMIIVQPKGDQAPGWTTYRGIVCYRYGGGPRNIIENTRHPRFMRFLSRHTGYWQYQIVAFLAGLHVAREVRPDVLIAYGDHSVLCTWLLGKLLRLPTVNRLFGTSLARYLEPGVRNRLGLLCHYIQRLAFQIPARYTIVCNDGSQGDRVANALGVPPTRLRFWRNGADRNHYDPHADKIALRHTLGLPENAILLFTISRMHGEKHIERILRALPAVVAAQPRVRFVVIGGGQEGPFLRAEAARLGIESLVHWAGPIDRDRLGDYINACDVFVAMSDRTNAANPLFETSLCAKPPVVLNTGSTSDAIADGVNGWLVPEDRPEELGPILIRVLGDPDQLEAVGQRALQWARENVLTWEARQSMEVALVVQAARLGRGSGVVERDPRAA